MRERGNGPRKAEKKQMMEISRRCVLASSSWAGARFSACLLRDKPLRLLMTGAPAERGLAAGFLSWMGGERCEWECGR